MTNLLARRYDVAEYFFNDQATEHIDLVEAAIDHVFCDSNDADIREAFNRYLKGEEVHFSSGVCESVTAGFGELDFNGYWQFPLPGNFIEKFLR